MLMLHASSRTACLNTGMKYASRQVASAVSLQLHYGFKGFGSILIPHDPISCESHSSPGVGTPELCTQQTEDA